MASAHVSVPRAKTNRPIRGPSITSASRTSDSARAAGGRRAR